MPLLRTRNYMSAILAIAMLASSAASAAPAPSTTDPYVTLSVLSGSAVTAEAAAAQDPYETPHGSMMPLWVALGVVFAGWASIILGNDDNNNNGYNIANQPGLIGPDASSSVTFSSYRGLSREQVRIDRHCPQRVESSHSADASFGSESAGRQWAAGGPGRRSQQR